MANRADLTVDTYQAVVSTFGEFLTVAVHTILYERDVYPRTSFLSARKYNCSVRQNRHPKVCKWIQDAVAAVEVEMLKVQTLLNPIDCLFLVKRILAVTVYSGCQFILGTQSQ